MSSFRASDECIVAGRRSPIAHRRGLAFCILGGLVLSCVSGVAHGQSVWKVGVARELITPERPMWMSGYGSRDRPADGKLTELWAKAMAIEDSQGNRLVLVTLDLVGIDRETAARIQSRVAKQVGLPRKALVLSTSHTHSGPVVGNCLRSMVFLDGSAWDLIDQYTSQLESKVVEVVTRALADLRHAEISWTVGRAHFAVNRRNNVEANVPALRSAQRLNGPVDHDVPVLVVREPSDAKQDAAELPKVRLVVCGYACHATVLSGYQWCGDWPGYAQSALEERFPGATAMVWAGCGADLNPLPRRDVELAKQYGNEIDQAVAAAIGRHEIPLNGSLDSQFAEVPVEFAMVPTREQLDETLKSSNRYEAARARLLLETMDRDGQLQTHYPYPIQTWRLGDGPTWVFLGGEVVVDYALRLKQELGAGKTWVAGYCNDVMAYIPSRRVLQEGGYEGGGAMVYYGLPSPWVESIEEQIIQETRRQVAQLGGPASDQATSKHSRSIVPRSYPDHQNLMVWRDDKDALQPIETPANWACRRADILVAMQAVMGRLPTDDELAPLDVQVRSREDFDGYARLWISYRVDATSQVPAHLYLPRSREADNHQKRPAVLALHPTSPLGKGVVAGEGPQENRNYAVELAKRGYVVLAPDYPSFGELADYDFHTDPYISGTMRAIVNHRRGIDLLVARDEVDADRIGVIGHSLGGHNAMFVGVFDERIRAVVSSCGWDPFHFYYGGKLAGWASDRYMPRIRELYGLDPAQMPFDFPEVAAALAPRGFFSCSPLRDANFDAQGVMLVEPSIRDVYQLLGAEENFIVRYPDSEHDFPEATRQQSYEFLDRVLAAQPSDVGAP
jgi:neutral ceramidase